LDYEARFKPTFCTDIADFDVNNLSLSQGGIDVIWASPDCTTFSVAAISHNWEYLHDIPFPKRSQAVKGFSNILHVLRIIQQLKPKYWFIENPMGMLRSMPWMKSLPRKEVTYCSYGDIRMKPTDIWTNCSHWTPRPKCHNGNKDCHHERAPRGSSTGTQGLKNAEERSRIPQQLCEEIVLACENDGAKAIRQVNLLKF